MTDKVQSGADMLAVATPRPWRVVPYGDDNSLVIHDARGDWRVCFMATPAKDGDFAGIEANANLIVAAVNSFGNPPEVPPSDMAAFGASEAACYLYPSEDQQSLREAFCAGAGHAVQVQPAPSPVAMDETGARFLTEIHKRTPDGEWIAVQHIPDGSWSVAKHPLPWLPGGEVATPAQPEADAGALPRAITLGKNQWIQIANAVAGDFVSVPVETFTKCALAWRRLLGIVPQAPAVAERAEALERLFQPPTDIGDIALAAAPQPEQEGE